jgi:putative inorganic carbon (HCO3(-)) transporter
MSEVIEELRRQQSDPPAVLRRNLGTVPIAIRRQPAFGVSSLVLALLSPYLALRVGYVQKALFAIVILDIPFQIGTHLYYREADAVSGALAGLSMSATTFALFVLYVSWFLQTLENRSHGFRSPTRLNLPLLSYLGFTALSLVAARDVRLSSFELFLLLQMYLVFLYVANFVGSRKDVLFVVFFLLVGCLAESLLMIALRLATVPSGLWGPVHLRVDTQVNGELTRVGGTVGSPNEAGAYLSLMLSLAVSVLFTDAGRKYKWLAAAALAFGGTALIFTFSRGAWISLVTAIVLFCFSVWRRNGSSLKAPIAVVATLFLLYLPFHSAVEARLLADDNGSAESRIPLMNLAFRIIADNPILGVGSNNFSAAMDSYLTSEFRRGFLYTVHNKYLLVWSEIGIAGLLAYLAFLFGALRKGWACWKQNDGLLSTLALGFTAAMIGNMVHQSVDIFHDRAVTQLLWLVAGLLFAMHGVLRAQPASFDTLSSIT